MHEKSIKILKTFFLELNKNVEEITFFFHPDNADGEMDISFNEDFDASLYLPELKDLMIENNFDPYDEANSGKKNAR